MIDWLLYKIIDGSNSSEWEWFWFEIDKLRYFRTLNKEEKREMNGNENCSAT